MEQHAGSISDFPIFFQKEAGIGQLLENTFSETPSPIRRENGRERKKQKSPLISRPDSGVRAAADGILLKSKKVLTFLDFALKLSYA